MENENKCACNMCGCAVKDGEKYCSDHCRDVCDQDIVEISCDCGHTGCQ
jgi:predicted nucleic acid-binding Zn ribbon protein